MVLGGALSRSREGGVEMCMGGSSGWYDPCLNDVRVIRRLMLSDAVYIGATSTSHCATTGWSY